MCFTLRLTAVSDVGGIRKPDHLTILKADQAPSATRTSAHACDKQQCAARRNGNCESHESGSQSTIPTLQSSHKEEAGDSHNKHEKVQVLKGSLQLRESSQSVAVHE